jgi:DNA-binding NtrC family response regulator
MDVRVVAPKHRELREEVNKGRFRADLFFRLAVLRVRVPALRERREDIPLLIRHFCAELGGAGEAGAPPRQLAEDLVTALAGQAWPGNVRELRSAVQRALVLGDAAGRPQELPAADPLLDLDETYGEAKERAIARWERQYVRRLIERFAGNLSQAAQAVGMSRNYLRKLAERYGVDR